MPEQITKEEIDARQPIELLAEILANREGGNCTMEGGNTFEDLRYAAGEAVDVLGAFLGAEYVRRARALAATARERTGRDA